MKELLETLDRYHIDARYEQTGSTSVALDEESAGRLKEEYELGKEAGDELVWLDKESMRAEVNSPTFYAGVRYLDGQDGVIDPA